MAASSSSTVVTSVTVRPSSVFGAEVSGGSVSAAEESGASPQAARERSIIAAIIKLISFFIAIPSFVIWQKLSVYVCKTELRRFLFPHLPQL